MSQQWMGQHILAICIIGVAGSLIMAATALIDARVNPEIEEKLPTEYHARAGNITFRGIEGERKLTAEIGNITPGPHNITIINYNGAVVINYTNLSLVESDRNTTDDFDIWFEVSEIMLHGLYVDDEVDEFDMEQLWDGSENPAYGWFKVYLFCSFVFIFSGFTTMGAMRWQEHKRHRNKGGGE